MSELTAEQVRDVLDYNPETGDFIWRKKTCRKVVAGTVAGSINQMGYVVIGINGELHYAHRLAWLWVTGAWPNLIDHADGDKANNAWINLRLATPMQNGLNARRAATNTSGMKGVSWHRAAGKWCAAIHVLGKKQYLGLFEFTHEAHAAYMNAAKKIDSNFARGE